MIQQPWLKEIVIIDDHSTDGSWEILTKIQKENPDLVRIFSNPTKGGNNARNYGFEQATGKYIQWLDADDTLLPGKLEAQVMALESNLECEIAYSDWRIDRYECHQLVASEEKFKLYTNDYLLELIKDNWCAPNNYLIKRSMAIKLANGFGWNPNTKVAQDREYFTKAGILGAQFLYVPGTYSVYNKWGDHTVSGISYLERSIKCYDLSLEYKRLIQVSSLALDKKKKYIKVLNAQALRTKFYHPKIEIRVDFSFNMVDWKEIHWKIRALLFFYLILKMIKIF